MQADDGSEVKQTIAICINCAEVAWGARGPGLSGAGKGKPLGDSQARNQGLLCARGRAIQHFAIAVAGQTKQDDEDDEGQSRDDEDTAFGPGRSPAENWSACRVCGKQTVLHPLPAVGGTE